MSTVASHQNFEPGAIDSNIAKDFVFESGDVRLIVRHPITKEKITGTAPSGALVFASPVWKKFFLPPWEVNSAVWRKEIDFSEDDTEMILVLLNITHLHFGKVPTEKMNCEQLFNLAVLYGGMIAWNW
jgi:hypothetical protein